MKRFVSTCIPVVLAAITIHCSQAHSGDVKSDGRLVVHEWGTFTNFSGSDGVKLEYRPLIDNDLPEFVLDRGWQAGLNPLFSKARLRGRQRMETPVTYFYTDRVREVNVRVQFPQGLLTEFYPPVQKMLPEFTANQFHKLPALKDSLLDWGSITLIPESQLQTQLKPSPLADRVNVEVMDRLLPSVGHSPHYGFARNTDSAIVHVQNKADQNRPRMPAGNFFEKFLFYRGMGNFKLPLHLTSMGEDVFKLTNGGADPVRSLFLVSVSSGELRFQSFDAIAAGKTMTLTQTGRKSTVAALGTAVSASLVAAGLYEKEAVSMVRTWKDSWFEEEGTRLFYIVPSSNTEKLLPLTVEPQPDEIVRVLVGRMEIMPPEQEHRILQLVRNSVKQRIEHKTQAAELKKQNKKPTEFGIPTEIVGLGRLAEPALIRVISISDDIAVRREGRLLLQQWQQTLNAGLKLTEQNIVTKRNL